MEYCLHMVPPMRILTTGSIILLMASVSCTGSSDAPVKVAELADLHDVTGMSEPVKNAGSSPSAKQTGDQGQGVSGRHRDDPTGSWVPAEFKAGKARFKDPGVYADGVVVGMIQFGELPVPLEPYWYEEEASVEFGPDTKDRQTKLVKQRRYAFSDYFKTIGLDVDQIKEVHIYGGSKRRVAVVISGDEMRKNRGFGFRFGGDVGGKPIPSCVGVVGDTQCPDNIKAVSVYLKRKPPIRQGGDFILDGKIVDGIPYYGEPLRGGIRVYLDNLLVTTIKRRMLLDDSLAVMSPDGKTKHWKLFALLQSQGVTTSDVQEAWLVYGDRRVKKVGRDELKDATFIASEQRKGEILFGKAEAPTNAFMLHTKPVSRKDLPVILPHESDVVVNTRSSKEQGS